jgi:uncharacterized protein (TIGR00725 family)
MPRKIVIAIVGSTDVRAERNARELGRLVANRGWVVLTGGRDEGVMRAAASGAKDASLASPGLTVGILPNARSAVGADIDVAVVTEMNEGRNNVVVMSGDVVVACGVDGPGTASEVALALRNGKRVVLIGAAPEAAAFFTVLDRRTATERSLCFVDTAEDAITRIDDALAGRAW